MHGGRGVRRPETAACVGGRRRAFLRGRGAADFEPGNVAGDALLPAQMSDTEHYERFAAECERLARKQVYPRDRKALLLMAEAWLLLAEHAFRSSEDAEQSPQ